MGKYEINVNSDSKLIFVVTHKNLKNPTSLCDLLFLYIYMSRNVTRLN